MSSMTDDPIRCKVMDCGLTREAHGLKNHVFSEEGHLVPRKATQMRVNPATVGTVALTGLVMRLVHILARKGVLDDNDIAFITSGADSGSPAGGSNPAVGVYPARPTG